jgi:hypothetical protein
MTKTIAKILMQVVGTLAGLLGALMLCVTPFMLYVVFTGKSVSVAVLLLSLFPLFVAVYFLYVAYLVWFRYSPRAVLHICGTLGFFVLGLALRFLDVADIDVSHGATLWQPFAFLGFLVFVFFAYRAASRYLSRLLFPPSNSEVHP